MRIPKTNKTIHIVRGKEKFWNALLGGAMVAPVTVFALYAISGQETFEAPGPEELRVAVGMFIAGSFGAALAYLSPNSDVPGSGTSGGKLAERLTEAEAELAAARALMASPPSQPGGAAPRGRVKPAGTPEPEPEPIPQPAVLAVKPLRPAPRPAERTDEDEAG